jgi:hypothetical protein
MKIKIKDTQLKKLLREVGGYDSTDVMGIHGGSVHGEITRIVTQTVDIIKQFSEHLVSGSLSKDKIMLGIFNFSEKVQSDVQRLKELSREIYIDDDFKSLMISYIQALQKVLKYFKLLSNISPGMVGGQPQMFSGGLGMDMSHSELSLKIAEKLVSLGDHIESLGEMFLIIIGRFSNRMQSDHDDSEDIF